MNMGIHVIKMPDLGEGIAEVEVVAWRVKPGDPVVEDQVLAEVMTDKATVEIPSPVHGIVLALGGALGEALAVGAELIRVEVEDAGNHAAGQAPPAPVAAASPIRTDMADETVPPVSAAVPDQLVTMEAAPSPAARPSARQAPDRAAVPGARPLAAPAVRQRAWDLGIELQFVHGSGPAGRIGHADLDAYIARTASGAALTAAATNHYPRLEGEESTPLIGLHRKIAQKMQESTRRIPHFTYVEEVDVSALEGLRAQLNTRWGEERGKLTLLPFLMRAIVLSVPSFPQVNARFDDEANRVTRYKQLHIGIATQTEAGLMVPVVRNAESRDLWDSATELARLAEAARNGTALRDELSGSTITITSLGALGGIMSTPIINHPEVAIVGVNRVVDRPVIRDGAMVARKMMNLSSSFDHRVIDGMLAAQFVQAIRAYLECPATLFVE
jgi:2-oxoisovalerate dehydrogenase E2 component (dihydrolipoyl transacylase)